ncbi:hypothetical protein [[Phormidium] sp. ETS-05]|uniref:hypothetical protein n=1 Tax=[Phormidium] sp. ETS-05 TaxID=222819 RepID=UPI0018EF1FC2|nr:hypothetical protein [[Phormidium] sp. ETS-05]
MVPILGAIEELICTAGQGMFCPQTQHNHGGTRQEMSLQATQPRCIASLERCGAPLIGGRTKLQEPNVRGCGRRLMLQAGKILE